MDPVEATLAAPEVEQASQPSEPAAPEPEQLLIAESAPDPDRTNAELKAVLEAVIYITEEPLTLAQMSVALGHPAEQIKRVLAELTADYAGEDRGITIREVAGGYKMGTKPEHHEAIRSFVKSLKPPLKLSLAALETLAVIAYKQPVTAPEVAEIRGVQGTGVLKTLLDRKLIGIAGRKQVVGKPILYKTTKDFLLQFGLKDLSELPTLKEFEDLGRLALSDDLPSTSSAPSSTQAAAEPAPTTAEENETSAVATEDDIG